MSNNNWSRMDCPIVDGDDLFRSYKVTLMRSPDLDAANNMIVEVRDTPNELGSIRTATFQPAANMVEWVNEPRPFQPDDVVHWKDRGKQTFSTGTVVYADELGVAINKHVGETVERVSLHPKTVRLGPPPDMLALVD